MLSRASSRCSPRPSPWLPPRWCWCASPMPPTCRRRTRRFGCWRRMAAWAAAVRRRAGRQAAARQAARVPCIGLRSYGGGARAVSNGAPGVGAARACRHGPGAAGLEPLHRHALRAAGRSLACIQRRAGDEDRPLRGPGSACGREARHQDEDGAGARRPARALRGGRLEFNATEGASPQTRGRHFQADQRVDRPALDRRTLLPGGPDDAAREGRRREARAG